MDYPFDLVFPEDNFQRRGIANIGVVEFRTGSRCFFDGIEYAYIAVVKVIHDNIVIAAFVKSGAGMTAYESESSGN